MKEWRTREDSNLWPLPSEDCGGAHSPKNTVTYESRNTPGIASTSVDNGGEAGALPPPRNESPGSRGGAAGADAGLEKSAETGSQKALRIATLEAAKPRHRAVAAALAAVLSLDEGEVAAWADLAVILRARLTERERALIANAFLRSLDPEIREGVASIALRGDRPDIGDPLPSFGNVLEDARFWASKASRRELKAYALAAFEALPQRDRRNFIAHVTAQRARRAA